VGQVAQNALIYGLAILVVERTGSAIHSSLFILSFVLASALFGPLTGLAADRLPKRLVTVTAHGLRGGLCLAYLFYGKGVWAIYGLNIPFFALSQFQATAEQAAVPAIVPQGRLAAANAFLNLATLGGLVVGAGGLAPLFLRTAGIEPLLIIGSMLFLSAALFTFRVGSMDGGLAPRLKRGLWGPLAEGWRALRGDVTAFAAAVDITLVNGSLLVGAALIPIYMVKVLETAPANAAYVFAPAGLGLLLGLRLSPWLARLWGNAPVATLGFLLFALALPLMALVEPIGASLAAHNPIPFQLPSPAPKVWIAVGLSGPLGFAYSLVNVSARAVLHERAPAHLRGRIMATQMVLGSLASIPPLVLAGVLAQVVGVRQVIVGTAAVALGAALYARLRRGVPAALETLRGGS